MAARPDEKAMISEKVAPVLVARTLGPFDLVVIFVAIVLFINNAAGLQFAGPSVFVFWIVAFATFLITGAFVTAQLGRMFPEEGSLYVWTHKVLGPFWGFFAGFVAWWPGPISLVFIGILFANFLQQFALFANPDCEFPCIFTENWQIGIVVLAVIWFSALMSYLRMRVTQNYVNVLFWFYAAAIFLIGFAGVWWLLQGNGSSTDFGTGWDPFQGDELALGLPANLTFFSFAILALLGIETPLNMGAEVTGGEKAIRTFLLWGCAIVMAAYLWATWGNMVVIEAGGANGTTGGAETVGLALGRWTGAAVSLVLAWVVLTVAVVYNYSFGRLLFVSGLEKRLPHQLGKVNRNKVPANAITLQIGDLDDPRDHRSSSSWARARPTRTSTSTRSMRASRSCGASRPRCCSWTSSSPSAPSRSGSSASGGSRSDGCTSAARWGSSSTSWRCSSSSWARGTPRASRRWPSGTAWMFGITAVSVVSGIVIYVVSQSTRKGKTDEELIELGEAEREIVEDMPRA